MEKHSIWKQKLAHKWIKFIFLRNESIWLFKKRHGIPFIRTRDRISVSRVFEVKFLLNRWRSNEVKKKGSKIQKKCGQIQGV